MTFIRIFLATTSVVTAAPIILFGASLQTWPAIVMGILSIMFAGAAVVV